MTDMVKKDRESDFMTWFLIFLVLGLLTSQLFLGMHTSTMGKTVSQLESKLEALQEENERIASNLAVYTSFPNVASKSGELGFTRPREILYLTQ